MLPHEYVARCADTFSDKIAFFDGARLRSWRQLHDRSSRLASALQGIGLRKDDTVAILAHDHVEHIEHWYSCLKGGLRRTGLNWRYAPREMVHILRDSNTKGLIIEANCVSHLKAHLEDFVSRGMILIGFGGDHGLPHDYERLIAKGSPDHVAVDVREDDVALVSYTSGSTGLPKGALIQHRAVRESLLHTNLMLGFRAEDVFLNPAPMAGAPLLCGSFSLMNGMATVLPDGDFEALRFLQLVQEHRVTSTVLVPTMLRRVIEVQRKEQFDISSLRFVVYGAAPTPPSLIHEAAEVLACDLYQLYGGTEVWTWSGCLRPEIHRRAFLGEPELLLSCGKPAVHCEYSVRDSEFKPVPNGEVGEVWIKSETLMQGYLNRPEETAETLREGWLSLGDIGRKDEEGFLYLLDRKKFLIICGGYNVYPATIENVLSLHEAVREVTVFGVPHHEWGEIVAAVVSLHTPGAASSEELIQYCHGKVGRWEVPKHIEIVDDLPRGATGKILKREIKDWLVSKPDRFAWNQGKVEKGGACTVSLD